MDTHIDTEIPLSDLFAALDVPTEEVLDSAKTLSEGLEQHKKVDHSIIDARILHALHTMPIGSSPHTVTTLADSTAMLTSAVYNTLAKQADYIRVLGKHVDKLTKLVAKQGDRIANQDNTIRSMGVEQRHMLSELYKNSQAKLCNHCFKEAGVLETGGVFYCSPCCYDKATSSEC